MAELPDVIVARMQMLKVTFDHLAIAVPSARGAWDRFAGDFGARWLGAEVANGFSLERFAFADGTRLEVLEPSTDGPDFLRRFLAVNGPSPHHLTFKVDDIEGAIEAVAAFGLVPAGVDTGDADWKELFLHPKDACGIVVQLAESASPPWSMPTPRDMPKPRTEPASVLKLVHLVRSLPDALELFSGLLKGEVTRETATEYERCAEVSWEGGPPIQLLQPLDPRTLLGSRLGDLPGRFDHLELAVADPSDVVVGASVDGAGHAWIDPSENHGLRVCLAPPASAGAILGGD